jgi:NTP pyrophosphatase (non-canonical NTP hydrolase)
MLQSEWANASHYVKTLANTFHDNAVVKGFYSDVDPSDIRDMLSIVAKIHEELGDLTQAMSSPGESETLPGFSNIEEELADVFIRFLDMVPVIADPVTFMLAVRAKHEHNLQRPYRHGKRV